MNFIQFNCPGCGQSIEAEEDAQFTQVKCPTCQREFFPDKTRLVRPTPAVGEERKGTRQAISFKRLAIALLVAVVFVPLVIFTVYPPYGEVAMKWLVLGLFGGDSTPPPPPHNLFWFAEHAQEDLLEKATNDIVGLHRIIKLDKNFFDPDPAKWTAEITAEYINHIGGVDRTNLPYRFHLYPEKNWVNNNFVTETNILAMLDDVKVFNRTMDAIRRGGD